MSNQHVAGAGPRRKVISAALLVVVASCGHGDDWGLVPGGDLDDPRYRDLRARVDVTVQPGTGALPTGCDTDAGTCPADVLAAAIGSACSINSYWNVPDSYCETDASYVEHQLCVAETLMTLVDAVTPQTVDVAGGTVVVGAQDTESQAEMARQAAWYAAMALSQGVSSLASDTNCSAADMALSAGSVKAPAGSPLTQMTAGVHLASLTRTAHQLMVEASDRAAQSAASASDAQRARLTDPAESEFLELAPIASRAAAAHFLIGGAHGLPGLRGVDVNGMFPRPRLSDAGLLALSLLRMSAADPSLLADTSPGHDIDAIMFDHTTALAMARSISGRLAVILPDASLLTASSAAAVYLRLGVPRTAFVEAREYLIAEARAFDRSPIAGLPAEPLPGASADTTASFSIPATDQAGATVPFHGTTISGMAWFAATRLEPHQPPPAWWAALTRYEPAAAVLSTNLSSTGTGPTWNWSSYGLMPGLTYGPRAIDMSGSEAQAYPVDVTGGYALSGLEQWAAGYAQQGIVRIDGLATSAATTQTRGILASLVGDIGQADVANLGATAAVGRGRVCTIGITGDSNKVHVRFDLEAAGLVGSDLLVVESHEALECAVDGTIEGAPCASVDITAGTIAAAWSSSTVATNALTAQYDRMLSQWDTQHFAGGMTSTGRPNVGVHSVFVLRRRDGATASQPGSYQALLGWMLPTPTTNVGTSRYLSCEHASMLPALDVRVRDIIAPSVEYPADSNVSCAGVRTDLRLPLENELTDDGNGVEDSWRHYLTLAQAAADQADMLGETLVQEGLEMDLRAESAVDQLQAICGVGIDVSPTRSVPSTHAAPCVSPYFSPSGASGTCSLDPVQYAVAHASDMADAAMLTSCLGELSDDNTYVALGDHPVCIWSSGGNRCGPDTTRPTLPCAYVANADNSCTETGSPPADYPTGATLTPVTTTLGLFHLPADPPTPTSPPNPDAFPCVGLARLRTLQSGSTMTDAEFTSIIQNAFFTHGEFAQHASQLSWHIRAGDIGQVMFGNTVMFATSGSHWPMQAVASAALRPNCGSGPCWTATTTSGATSALATYTNSLFGIGAMGMLADDTSTAERELRARLNDLMARAVLAAHVMGGASLRGSQFPYYHDPVFHLQFRHGNFTLQTSGIYQSDEGALFVDAADGDMDPGTEFAESDLDSVAQIASGGAVDWTHCFYDGACTQAFQASSVTATTGTGSYDGAGLSLPMLVMTLGASVERGNVDAQTVSLWGEGAQRGSFEQSFVGGLLYAIRHGQTPSSAGMMQLSTPDGVVQLNELSNYFASSHDTGGGFNGTRANNQAFAEAMGHGLSAIDFLNGLEMTCLAASTDAGHPDPITYGCDQPLPLQTVGDVLNSTGYLDCVADRASQSAGLSVLRGLPQSVIDAVTRGGPSVGGSAGGTYGQQVADIQAALIQLRDEQYGIADDIRRYSDEVEVARNTVRHYEIASQIQDIALESTTLNEITSCIVSVAHVAEATASGGIEGAVSAGGATMGAIATCSNGMLQTALARQMRMLQGQDGALDIQNALSNADIQFVNTASSIRAHSVAIQAALSRIQGAIGQLRTLQGQARTALSRALFLDSTATGTTLAVDTVEHRRYNTTLTRYRDAYQRALRLAYIARLALEQRLAVHLSEMHDDLVSVNAPARWADELCTLTPIDYETLRNSSADASVASPDNYAGYYLGDYVRRLGQVFESYPFAYPFHEGTDTVVLSLRDDVFRVRRECDDVVPNLLYNAGQLDARQSSTHAGWAPVGCDDPTGYLPTDSCIDVAREGDTGPVVTAGDALGPPVGTRVTFGAEAVSQTRYSQFVDIEAGRYRLSWFAYIPAGLAIADRIDPRGSVRALDSAGNPYAILDVVSPSGHVPQTRATDAGGWTAYDYFFDVSRDGPLEVAVLPAVPSMTEVHDAAVMVTGVQLVRAGASFGGDVNANVPVTPTGTLATLFEPPAFFNTDGSRTQRVGGCADDGTEFRRRAFSQACESVCPDGYGGTCDPTLASQRCAWQTSFSVSSDSFERLLVGQPAGFAAGNFNYRFQSIGVNLVGTGLRNCSLSGTSGCYSSGNFSFSMVHQGPFLVRDAGGSPYLAPLFTGRIENARALAAERYISNPISGADQALLQPYVRTEFSGRPLGGSMVLQIWDDDTLAFSRLEDVQLVLTYRYWQHQR